MSSDKTSTTRAKWAAEAQAHGWTWLSKINDNKSEYRCNTCGSKQHANMNAIRNGNARCVECKQSKWKSEAHDNGFKWLFNVDKSSGLYECVTCGYRVKLYTYHMRKGQVSCSCCQEEKWKREAQLQGWVWQKRHNCVKSIYRHLCGHEQHTQMSAMRNGLVTCHGCGDSWVTKPSNTYLLRIKIDNTCFLKLGIARDVGVRTTTYGLPDHARVEIVRTIAYPTGQQAVGHEKRIHRTITEHPAVIRFDASYWMGNGHTECYTYSKEAENTLSHAMFVESTRK